MACTSVILGNAKKRLQAILVKNKAYNGACVHLYIACALQWVGTAWSARARTYRTARNAKTRRIAVLWSRRPHKRMNGRERYFIALRSTIQYKASWGISRRSYGFSDSARADPWQDGRKKEKILKRLEKRRKCELFKDNEL